MKRFYDREDFYRYKEIVSDESNLEIVKLDMIRLNAGKQMV